MSAVPHMRAVRLEDEAGVASPPPKEHADCLAFVSDDQTREVIRAVASPRFPGLRIRMGGTREALDQLGQGAAPRVLVVDVSDAPKPMGAMLPIMTAFGDETRVIAIGSMNDVNLYRDMIEAGVVEYLVKPISEQSFANALGRLHAKPAVAPAPAAPAPAAAGAPERKTLIAVLGTRGGVGASTVASNFAWLVANDLKKRTTLLDLDLQNGTIALALDIEPTRGLREALENPDRIDTLFINSATARIGERLLVMAAEESVDEDVHYDGHAIDLLIAELHRQTECIVVDLPRSAPSARARVLHAASEVVIVTELTLAGLRDAIRLQGVVQHAAPQARVTFVANRASGREPAVSRSEFEKALGHSLAFVIPEDLRAGTAASNSGKPIVAAASGSKVVQPLRALALRLCGGAQAKPKRALLKFFGK